MTTVLMDNPGQVRLTNTALPEIGPEDVLLEPVFAGLCGTDLSSYRGTNPLVSYPRIPGHEISAQLKAKGNQVPEEIRIGGLFTVSPYSHCGVCPACRAARRNTCAYNQTLGVQRDGAMRQYFAISYRKLYSSSLLNAAELVLTEPLSVGYHAVNRGGVKKEDTVLVLGCGTIGMGALIAAVSKGAKVIAVDLSAKKLEIARVFGAAHTLQPGKEPLDEAVRAMTQGEGAAVVIEAVGAAATYRSALECAAFAGRVVCLGYAKNDIPLNTSLIVRKELTILGSRNALDEFSEVITLLEKRKYPYASLITTIYPLERVAEAFSDWNATPDEFMKILVRMS